MTIERMARCHPDTPASQIVDRDEITVVTMHKSRKQRTSRGPPDPEPTIEAFAVDVVRLAGFIPKKRQPLPGTGKLWQGYKLLLYFVENYRLMRDMNMIKFNESTVSG